MKRLLLRADASSRMGTGHVMRGIALAQAWQDLGGEVALLSRELPPALADRARAEGILLLPAADGTGDAADTGYAAAEASWVVIDGYQFDAPFCERVSHAAKHVLLIDDLGRLAHYPVELVLNQNINASPEMYQRRSACPGLLLGACHALLRREFRRPPVTRDPFERCERVLVTLGGSDADNVTEKVIEALLVLPHLDVKVVIGSSNSRREALRQQCAASGGRINLLHAVHDMVPLMDWAQLALSAGGTSVLELASRGVPTLLIAIADNQVAICETMNQRGVMAYAGWHESATAETLSAVVGQLASDSSRAQRADFAARGRRLVDGRGAARVAREMLARDAKSSVRVRRATAEDAQRVLEWANDPVTRAASFNQREITSDEHRSWFARRLADASCRILIGEDAAGTPFGMVRFDQDGHVATISINLAPEHRQRGLGTALILLACRDLMEDSPGRQVRALIRPENTISARAFRRAGFESAPDVDVTGQRALCMVLD